MLFAARQAHNPYDGGSLVRDALLSNQNSARRCHGLKYGIDEDLVVKRLGEKGGRTILHGQASDGVLIVRRNDDDARLGRDRARALFGVRGRSYLGSRYRLAQPLQDYVWRT